MVRKFSIDCQLAGSVGENAPVKHAIPNPSQRRVTRSRSRDLESTGRSDDVGPAGAPADGARRRWGQNKGRMSLGVVAEEPPYDSPQKSVHRYANQVIPESLDDTVNISGTTFLPEDADTNLDPDMMMETLPDLERAAKNVLDYLVPSSADPVSIVNTAKRVADPNSTQSKRLRHSVSNLAVQAKWFGSQTYIDVKHVSQLLTSALERKSVQVGKDWSADPILHQANCARFALEVLLANAGTDSTNRAIKNLEDLFPLPFMNDLSESQHERAIGESSLRKDTFDLALELRTQSLILKLEEDQYKLDFLPEVAIRQHFFDLETFDEDAFDSSVAPPRGLNIGRFQGSEDFPEQYRDAVCDRYNEILVLISEAGDNSFDIKELKSAYRWQKFVLRAVQWLRKRIQEIVQALQGQQSVQTMHKEFFADQDRIESATATPRPSATPAVEKRAPVPAATDDEHQGLPPPRAEERMRGAPKEDQRAPVSTAESRERRKSSKPVFLNPVSIQRLMQRQQRSRLSREASETRRQPDVVAPVMDGESTQSASDLRLQTPPAPSQIAQIAQGEPDEIAASPEGSPTLLPEDHYLSVDDSQLNIGDHVGAGLERSHSPPVVNRFTREHHHEPSYGHRPRTPSRLSFVPSSQDILRAVEETQSPTRSAQRSRLDRRQAFIDRQDNAERVSPISQEADLLSAARRRDLPPATRKRTRQESEDEDASSDDFSDYGRVLDPSRKRQEKAELQRKKRQRVGDDHDESASQLQQGLQASTQNREAQGQLEVVRRPETPPQTQRSPSRQWAKTSDFGSNRTFTPSQSKGRQRWTPAEDARLIRLIGEHGCRWATIMRQNDAQAAEDGEVQIQGRDQVQLKDRARNLKIAFLRYVPVCHLGLSFRALPFPCRQACLGYFH
ncbi:uncharacterized protein P174DRAFT_462253 [Aspergillus novofumigatus IBT 16806]|uniref:Uncharacterized protein n=1 Tax=Aspergillus novofumigatus (strain IBT 16806) TaxID=1392255 RepID=A0A2I1C255_ASPN1|nr:uncharacterized protein P174DRAFT_462253 [Aspergillus novofumigatus IBT 16806]PKX91724.1 hypothetical protein P174DRAFT_462253 [Aspergillus novofumigatus IBT 16806]